jgi:hypothetical protein
MTGSPHPDFWQRRPAARPAVALERRTHILLADTLRAACRPGWWWSHIPSGELRTEQTGALLKRMGLQRGMADMLLISPIGTHYWLELKRGNAPLTDGQENFAAMCRDRCVPYQIARSYDQAVAALQQWGAL